jgi:hypothetical protein
MGTVENVIGDEHSTDDPYEPFDARRSAIPLDIVHDDSADLLRLRHTVSR